MFAVHVVTLSSCATASPATLVFVLGRWEVYRVNVDTCL